MTTEHTYIIYRKFDFKVEEKCQKVHVESLSKFQCLKNKKKQSERIKFFFNVSLYVPLFTLSKVKEKKNMPNAILYHAHKNMPIV